jgi:hypothetical protein
MPTATLVQLVAMAILILVSGPRLLDSGLAPGYRIAHGALVSAAVAVIVWRVRQLRKR